MNNKINTELDISVSIPKMDSRFMDTIMYFGIDEVSIGAKTSENGK